MNFNDTLATASHALNDGQTITPELGKQLFNLYDQICQRSPELTLNLDLNPPFPAPQNPDFKFIDLFAGIGGFRLAFQSQGGKCVFSSEWDKNAQKTYFANYGDIPFGDIQKIDPADVPDHDILLGGFPCQAFSIAGYRQGFDDSKGRGNLFFNIRDILNAKKPKALLLENVKNLLTHDKGNTFSTIKKELENLGYHISYKVLNSKDHGNTPQTRERIFIVGFLQESDLLKFTWPETIPLTNSIQKIVENSAAPEFYYNRFKIYPTLQENVTKKNTIYQWRRVYVRENKSNACPTLTANMGTGGHNVPLVIDSQDIRKLTPRECARFQGYPDNFILPKSLANSHLYKQIGNSVTVPLVQRIAERLSDILANKA